RASPSAPSFVWPSFFSGDVPVVGLVGLVQPDRNRASSANGSAAVSIFFMTVCLLRAERNPFFHRMRWPALLGPDGNSGQANAQGVVPARWHVRAALSRAAEPGV